MLEPKDYIAIVAALVAIGAAAVSAYVALRGQRRQYFADLRKWADEACEALSTAVHACDLNPAHKDGGGFFTKRHELRVKLSSLVDRGRWFFPNLLHTEVGVEKDEAYRGLSRRWTGRAEAGRGWLIAFCLVPTLCVGMVFGRSAVSCCAY